MKRYTIQTGKHRYSEVASDPSAAVVGAFTRKAPKDPGILTRCKSKGEPWQYISTEAMLRDAGYTIRS